MFHFVNVVDDLEMKITHVIRGEDHLSNTPKHIALFRAFGVEPPKYAHIPLILNLDGTKMSKATQPAELFSPRSVVCGRRLRRRRCGTIFVCWAGRQRTDEELPIAEVIAKFDLPQVRRHNAKFDIAKLEWINGQYLNALTPERSIGGQAVPREGGVTRASGPIGGRVFESVEEKVTLLKVFTGPDCACFFTEDFAARSGGGGEILRGPAATTGGWAGCGAVRHGRTWQAAGVGPGAERAGGGRWA